MLAAAEAADQPPCVKEQVLTKAEAWEYTPPNPSTKEQLAEETKQRRLAEADAAISLDESLASIQRAYETRMELLGPCDSLTLHAGYRLAAWLNGPSYALNDDVAAATMLRDLFAKRDAEQCSLSDDENPTPKDLAILALAHYLLVKALPESDPTRIDHQKTAYELTQRAKSIMADYDALEHSQSKRIEYPQCVKQLVASVGVT